VVIGITVLAAFILYLVTHGLWLVVHQGLR
jgi:hypothetical protein